MFILACDRGRKGFRTMTFFNLGLKCCKQSLNIGEILLLDDIKGFTSRKLYKTHCPICDEDVVIITEKSIEQDKIYVNERRGIEAVKTLYREKKRKLQVFPDISSSNLFGWIYGINTQIKTQSGTISQTRQYSSDFKGNKRLVKQIYTRNNNCGTRISTKTQTQNASISDAAYSTR